MKKILTSILIILVPTLFGQKMTEKEWDELASADKRLLPKYGHLPKTSDEKNADKEFIQTVLKNDTTNRKGSEHLINLGFDYFYKGDLKTAMYRFNQAYLLDSTNTDIYWGYGGVYMTLGNNNKAKTQFATGLSVNPKNKNLLLNYGACLLSNYYELKSTDKENAIKNLDSAIACFKKSYALDSNDQNITHRLSICYWNKNDCENAWKYYDECKALGGRPITKDYTNALQNKCKR